jgi:SSS family solute:Na+ symporter
MRQTGGRRRSIEAAVTDLLPFGAGAWLFIGLYVFSLLFFGWFGYRARGENTLRDFYIAGSGFGFLVLLLTLYATQYSGNTLFGFTGKTYRIGYAWLMSVHFMIAIVVFYALFAIPLHRLSQRRAYVTPVDYLNDRYGSRAISLIAAVIMVVAVTNFLLAQLMAMGRAMQGLAGPHGDLAYRYGVVVLALIMVVYGTLGGLRAVAWSDVIQGGVLMIGFVVLLGVMMYEFGPLSRATNVILSLPDPAQARKIMPPSPEMQREWLSYILMVGMGAALYPQAIQRIYASRSEQVLRRSMAAMAFLPFVTALIAVVTGIYAIAHVAGLQGADSDQVLTRLLRLIQQESALGYWLVVLLFAAILSAIMSTADSALLSISSMLTKDIYAGFINRTAVEADLTRLGKRLSWALITLLVILAIALKEKASLVTLLDRKFDILVQLAPAFMLGIHWDGLQRTPVLAGLIAGLLVALILAFVPFGFVVGGKIAGLHPGLYGLGLNLLIAVGGSLWTGRDARPGVRL